MTAWTSDEPARIGRADELQISSRRADESLRPFATIWVVLVGNELFVRSAHGRDNPWFRHALAAGAGRVRTGGVERDVAFEQQRRDTGAPVTAAHHAKYDRYGPATVSTVVSPDAVWSTLRLVPR
jgi:hypothetical protein